MSWAEVKADQVINIINGAMAVEKDGIQHPANIFSVWSSDELIKIGYYPYNEIKEQQDSRFYSHGKIEYTISDTHVTGTITAKAKDIKDVKIKYLKQINTRAYDLLHPTDWIIVKNKELGTTVDSKVTTFRAAVRTKCNELEKAITDASTFTEIVAVIDSPGVDENEDMIPSSINDWPVLDEKKFYSEEE
jgi:hypothetical protein